MSQFKHGSFRKKEYILQEYLRKNYPIEVIGLFMTTSDYEVELLFQHILNEEKSDPYGPFKMFIRKHNGIEFLK
jgi:hypothetical protein